MFALSIGAVVWTPMGAKRTWVTAPAATPATAMAPGSMPSTLMPWLAARDSPKKPTPVIIMMAGVAEAAAIQPMSAWAGEERRFDDTPLIGGWIGSYG